MTVPLHAPSDHRGRIAATRALWSALDAAATPFSALVTLAVLVRALGTSEYGVLVIAMAASGLSLAINPAIAATTTKFVAELSGGRKAGNQTPARVITVALLAVAAIDAVLLLGTAAFHGFLTAWIFGTAAGTAHPGLVLWLAALSTALQQIETVVAGAIRGLERFRRQALIELVSRLMLTMAVISVAWQTRSLVPILSAQCVVYFVSMLARAFALRRVLPDRRLFECPRLAEAALLLRYGGWMGLTALAGTVYTSFDRIMIGRVLSTAAAGVYNIELQITQLIHFVPTSAFAFALPLFSRLAAPGNARNAEIRRAFRAFLMGITLTAAIVAAALTLCWHGLLTLLAGADVGEGRSVVMWLLVLNFLLLAVNVAPYYFLIAVGKARTVALVTTISMVVALVLMVLLIPRYGLIGAALGRLAYVAGSLILLQRALKQLEHEGGMRDGR